MVLSSLRRSKKRSALASGLSTNEYKTPACSPTKKRSLPGQRARSKGCSNFSFGNARTTLKGGGGSGEPTTRDVVHGFRANFAGSDAFGLGESAAEETSHVKNPIRNNGAKDRMLVGDSGLQNIEGSRFGTVHF